MPRFVDSRLWADYLAFLSGFDHYFYVFVSPCRKVTVGIAHFIKNVFKELKKCNSLGYMKLIGLSE